ncbi:MAG: hypothetical protein WBB74_00405 [Gaiellaceae bacterium]
MEPPLRRIGLACLLVLAFALGLRLAPAAATGPERTASAALARNLVSDGAFNGGLGGWRGEHATLYRIRNGVEGQALRVFPRQRGRFAAARRPRPVAWAIRGTVYIATGWMRSRQPGRRVCLRLSEFSYGARVGSSAACLRTRRAWKLVHVRYKARRNGSEIGIAVQSSRASFDVDQISLQRWAGTRTRAKRCKSGSCPSTTSSGSTGTSTTTGGSTTPTSTAGRWYSSDSPFNRPIPSDAAVDPNSSAMVKTLVDGAVHGFAIAAKLWSFTVYYASPSTPKQTVSLTASWSPFRSISGVPIPPNAAPDPAGDGSMTVIDPVTGCEYDFWQAHQNTGGSWSASWANATFVSSSGIYAGGDSARASGFANGLGLIRPEEMSAGVIPHALAFSYPYPKAGGHVWPATSSDGKSTVSSAMPEGAHVQLDPSLNLDSLGLTPWQKTVAVALQIYGMYLSDGGGTVSLNAQNPLSTSMGYPWGDVDFAMLPTSLLSHMRVLSLPPLDNKPGYIVPTSCATLN